MPPLKSHLPTLWIGIATTFQRTSSKSILSLERYCSANPEFLFKILPLLGKDLDRALETGKFSLTKGHFRRLKNCAYPVFLQEYFKEIFEKEGWIKDGFDVSVLKQLRTLCFLFYKFEVPFSDEEVHSACEKFVSTDNMVKNHFSEMQLLKLKMQLKELLPDDPYDIRPRHSSGATADRLTNLDKRCVKWYIPQLTEVYGLDALFNSHAHAKVWMQNNKLVPLTPKARVTFVPKDARGPRTICCENHQLMFFQQGIMHAWYEHIESDSPARGYINFTDQTKNQELAYYGSMTREYATIDLKDASDLVSWKLVSQVFPEKWVAALRATRSTTAQLPNGQEVVMKKFAPMGSALCFPVEALIFYTIARQVTDRVWVYGDDIIVENNCFQLVIDLLEEYGLMVNHEKSLHHGFFRESCGGDFYKGYNITPIRCKSVDLVSVYALANNLADAFSDKTGEAVIRWFESVESCVLLRLPRSYRPSTISGEGWSRKIARYGENQLLAFYTDNPNHFLVCKRRYNSDLQRYELRHLGKKQHQKTYHENDVIGYDLLHDYFTNSYESNYPLTDDYLRSLGPIGPYKSYSPSFDGSTSSVYTSSTSTVGYTWVPEQE